MSSVHKTIVEELDREIERLSIVRAYHLTKANAEQPPPPPPPPARETPRQASSPTPRAVSHRPQETGYAGMQKHKMAEEILRKHGSPITVQLMWELALKGGCEDSANPRGAQNALFTAMTRHSETFWKPQTGLWALVEWKAKAGD